MKTERRHELKQNDLADWLGKSIESVEHNYRVILGVFLVLALVVGAFLYLRSESSQKRAEGWNQYFRAASSNSIVEMLDVAERFPDTSAGVWGRLAVADAQLIDGVNKLFNDRAEANDELRKASANYQLVLDSSVAKSEPLVGQRATWGLARATESLGDLAKSRTLYESLADDSKATNAAFADQARRRLADLGRQSTKEFYDWFAKQESKTTFDSGTGGASGFNLNDLPDEPDIKPSGLNVSLDPNTEPAKAKAPAEGAENTSEEPTKTQGEQAPAAPSEPPASSPDGGQPPAQPAPEPAAPPANPPGQP